MSFEEFEFITCKNCESPCYVFEIDLKGEIASAFCQVCGNDDVTDFAKPDDEEMEPDE